jgi:putative ABC transport system permease protein
VSGLLAALRIARRDARRARARSALVVAMIALPVLGVGAADVLWRTFQLSDEQQAVRLLGAADGQLVDTGETSVQQYDGGYTSSGQPRSGRVPAPSTFLPPGSRVVRDRSVVEPLSAGDVRVEASVRGLDLHDPATTGLYRLVGGRLPSGRGEAAITRALAQRLGVRVGGAVGLPSGSSLEVVGLLASPRRLDELTANVVAADLPAGATEQPALVDAPHALTVDDVRRANAVGVVLQPRTSLPLPAAPFGTAASLAASSLTAVSLVVGMALLEVVLLAGPAFAVGAKRQSRELALVAAVGGDRRDVRRIVLGSGLVLGFVGGALGVLAGTALARLALPVLSERTGDVPGPFDLRAADLAGLVLVGALTAVLAALVPARNASRQDVVAALTGRRGQLRSLRRTPVLGMAAAVAGTLLALHGARQRSVNTILAGSAIAELGLVATTPSLVGLVGRLSPRLPLAPRLALRDAARNRGRTAPAVSAVLAAVAGSVAVGTFLSSLDKYDEQAYQLRAPLGSITVPAPDPARADVRDVVSALGRAFPDRRAVLVQTLQQPDRTVGVEAVTTLPCSVQPGRVPTREELLRASREPGCGRQRQDPGSSPVFVGGADVLEAVTGARGRRYDAVLAGGGAVTTPAAVKAGLAHVVVRTDTGRLGATLLVPAAVLGPDALPATVLSPAAAARTGVRPQPSLVVLLGAVPTAAEEDRALAVVAAYGIQYVQVERGYTSSRGTGLLALALASAVIVLGASGVATGLAAADGRPDLATLAAVGASPVTRRTLAAFQSAVTAGLGTVLGVVAGLVPAIGMVRALNAEALHAPFPRLDPYPLVLPWLNITVALVVVPLLAALAAALMTRSRLPMVRRTA